LSAKIRVAIIVAMLLGANLAMMGYAHVRSMPLRQELDGFPRQFNAWTSTELPPLTAREREVLKTITCSGPIRRMEYPWHYSLFITNRNAVAMRCTLRKTAFRVRAGSL
jgi:hypothetical protein